MYGGGYMNIHHVQTKGTMTNSIYQTKLANREHYNEASFTRNEQVTISEQGLAMFTASLKLNKPSKNDPLVQRFQQFYDEYSSAEAIEKRQLEQLEKEQAYNRLEDEFSLKGVHYVFPENTLHHTIHKALEGKVVNASLYAAELASAIRSSVSMSDKSAEERAAYREMALKQSQYIAENYFRNEQEAASFMNEINMYYENDILRDKGYVVIDNSDLQPFKNYSSSIANDNGSFYTLAKRYMDKDYFERFMNGEGTAAESAKFFMQLENNKEKYLEEIIEEFELIEHQVEELVTVTKSMFESFEWESGLVTGTKEELPDYLDEVLKWNKHMLNLFL